MTLYTDGRTWYRIPDRPMPAGDLRLTDPEGRVMHVDPEAVRAFELSDVDAVRAFTGLIGEDPGTLMRAVLEKVRGTVTVDAPEGDDLGAIEAAAHQLVSKFVTMSKFQAVSVAASVLQPRDHDVEAVFGPAIHDAMARHFAEVWRQMPVPVAKPGQTETRVLACTVAELRSGGPRAFEFPGGYKRLAADLVDGPVWVRWSYVEPGRSIGMAYDGLVWIDDHWAWFPKPWRALQRE